MKQPTTKRIGLAREFVRTCKKRKRGVKIADSMGNELTGGGLLTRSLILRRLLTRRVLAEDESFVGLLLPPTVAAVVANMAIALDRRKAVNLNYTASSEILNQCIAMAGIRHVLTSRTVMEKLDLKLDAYLVPAHWLSFALGLHRVQADDLVTLIFTSGSTGMPKGVMLTEANICSNVEAIEQVIHLQRDDVLLGILPFFHSFGYTVTLWAVMTIDIQGAYHFNPLDGRQVGKLCKKQGVTVLLATPTFLRTYLRRCDREDFESVDTVVVGAERLPPELSDAFEQQFGVRPVEGYGTTECSPLVSVNIPPSRSLGKQAIDAKEGTVGIPVPGVAAKVTDLDTGEDLGTGRPGMLWIKGPNVMKGYFHREDLTADAIRDGWYRLVSNRGCGRDRRGRVHPDHRSREPLLEDRRRDGAPHPDRRSVGANHPSRRRRRAQSRGDVRSGSAKRGTPGGHPHRIGQDARGTLRGVGPCRFAQSVHPVAGQFSPSRAVADAGLGQAGLEGHQADRIGTIRWSEVMAA